MIEGTDKVKLYSYIEKIGASYGFEIFTSIFIKANKRYIYIGEIPENRGSSIPF